MEASGRSDRGATLAVQPVDGELHLRLGGRLEARTIGPLWHRALAAVRERRSETLVIDAAEVDYCDTAGAALLLALDEEQRVVGGRARLEHLADEFVALLQVVRRATPAGDVAAPARKSAVREIGRGTVLLLRDCVGVVGYVGWLVAAAGRVMAQPRLLRGRDLMRSMQNAGVNALPVVVLITFLLGLVLCYQLAAIFQRFGADRYLADMLAVALVRELAPLMTAIALTARSGSAFAAEIGTMRVNEEVDALQVMALDPVVFLALPRVLAVMLLTPLLSVFAIYAGLVGGALVWVFTLGLPLSLYERRVTAAVDVGDLWGGLVKAVAFGVLVAAIGCIRGMQTRGGALAVGSSTTRAVVTGILLIAITDAVFAVIYFHLGI